MQSAVSAFRDFFPEARIDYIVKKSVACIMEGNPDISNLYPLFTGGIFPSENDLVSLKKLMEENQYDLCYNCSPFFGPEDFPQGQTVLNFLTTASQITRNEMDQIGNNHSLFQCYDLPHRLLSLDREPRRRQPLAGVPLVLSDRALEEAQAFLRKNQVPNRTPLILFNPDTASIYTRIPFDRQVELLKRLTALPCRILLGTAFTEKDIESRLVEKLNGEERSKVTIVPRSLSLDGYCALIDLMDVFISGDTGPLHMGAARKLSKSGKAKFRNKTYVVSVFGATPARVSGYDSNDPLFQPANQDAPSKTYVAGSPCRNVTCVNKMAKTCKVVRCFEVLDVEKIAGDIQKYLESLKTAPVR